MTRKGCGAKRNIRAWDCLLLVVTAFFPIISSANHGPGTSGGGSSTISGETVKENDTRVSIDSSYTSYERLSDEEIKKLAEKSGDFDGLRDSFLENVTFSYGATDDLELSAQLGWYSGRGFSETHVPSERISKSQRHSEESDAETATGSPEGLTDMLLRGKYRIVGGDFQHLSILGGVYLPTGDNDEKLSNGEKLEPSSQPGTGAFGYQAGVSYSRELTSRISLDASEIYTLRTPEDGFEVGDRMDGGIALTYRLDEVEDSHSKAGVFIELTHNWLGKDSEAEEGLNDNSGGTSYYLTSGVRYRIGHDVAFMIAPSIPLKQNLNGEQLETDFRLYAQLSVTI